MTKRLIAYKEDDMNENEIYASIGEAGIRSIVANFYRQIPDDDILGPMYPQHDMAGAEKRLADFLLFRFGGPDNYLKERGHPRLRMRHAPFSVDQSARDRWVALMTQATQDANIDAEPRKVILEFLGNVATFLMNQ